MTSVEAQTETMEFQTEVRDLLHLMIHSLYSNKEIFLRELISNASDASDKLRFEALKDESLFGEDSELDIRIAFDKEQRTVSIIDKGIGMNREEVIKNIGTIAKSGTREFLTSLTGDQAKDNHLIGQFGVGFYSCFIVADKITLSSRSAKDSADQGIRWVSEGEGAYTLENIDKPERGTEITLHLKEGEDEFLEAYRLKSIVQKFSDHIAFPIKMVVEKPPVEASEEDDKVVAEQSAPEYETVNKASALWMRPKKEIKEEEYHEFYKHVSHDFEDPLCYTHNRVEGKYEYTSLLYIPTRAPFDLWDRDSKHGVKLYVRRVFIMDDAEKLMPRYLRFVRGLIDSDDLPLNISREILQHNKVVDAIRSASVKRILNTLEDMAKKDAKKYQKFWDTFGMVIKEGPGEDFANKEGIAKLIRFSSTQTDDKAQTVSLASYIERMKEGQEKIYYITADHFATAKNSPHLEVFRKKGVEVLLLSDRVDEWLVSNLNDFDGKSLQSVARGDLDLSKIGDPKDQEEQNKKDEEAAEEYKDLLAKVKESLGDKVKDVRLSKRLTTSPACLVADEDGMNANLERILKASGQEVPSSKPMFELNPEHPLVNRLQASQEGERFADLTQILFDQALLSEGGQLEDPAQFVHKLNELLLSLAS